MCQLCVHHFWARKCKRNRDGRRSFWELKKQFWFFLGCLALKGPEWKLLRHLLGNWAEKRRCQLCVVLELAPLRGEIISSHIHKTGSWNPLGVLFEISVTCEQAPGESERNEGACRHSIDAAVLWYQLLVSWYDWLNRWLLTSLRWIFDRSL